MNNQFRNIDLYIRIIIVIVNIYIYVLVPFLLMKIIFKNDENRIVFFTFDKNISYLELK